MAVSPRFRKTNFVRLCADENRPWLVVLFVGNVEVHEVVFALNHNRVIVLRDTCRWKPRNQASRSRCPAEHRQIPDLVG